MKYYKGDGDEFYYSSIVNLSSRNVNHFNGIYRTWIKVIEKRETSVQV